MAQNIFRRFVSEAKAVLDAADKQTLAVFSKWGAFARRNAKGLLRKAKGPSKAPNPPHSHGQQLLKKFIYFAVEPQGPDVIVGPAKLNGMLGDAPRALEKGGKSTVRRGSRRQPRLQRVTIAKRPYILPAALKANRELPGLWTHSVKR